MSADVLPLAREEFALCPRVGFSLPDLSSQVLANLYHVQEVAVPMKHRSEERCYHQKMVALGNCEKTNATETL